MKTYLFSFKFLIFSATLSLSLLVSCVSASTQTSCEQEIVAVPCIDPNQIDSSAVCTAQYDPVCGCDDSTYANACIADKNGVQSWVEGECCD